MLACARPASIGHMAASLVKWESRADPFPGDLRTGSVLRLTRILPGKSASTTKTPVGIHPAGQQQARCLRDFPGHVASRTDAIFPERPCGRVLGAASSDRNVRNRRSDCGAVCRLPATRCFGGRLIHSHHSGGGLSSGTCRVKTTRIARALRLPNALPLALAYSMQTPANDYTGGLLTLGYALEAKCLRAFGAAS